MFDYQVMTEQEALQARFSLLKDGAYDATINSCEFRVSNNGNPMFDIKLDVYDENGRPCVVRDFWLFTPQMMWKAIHGSESAGLLKEYEEKKLKPEILVGKNVRVNIETQQGSLIPHDKLNGKPEGSRYPDKNVVSDYLRKSPNALPKNSDEFIDDKDIPF